MDENWEDAVDQWRARRKQKRATSGDYLDVASSNEADPQPSNSTKPKIKTFQQMVEEKEERERKKWEIRNSIGSSNEYLSTALDTEMIQPETEIPVSANYTESNESYQMSSAKRYEKSKQTAISETKSNASNSSQRSPKLSDSATTASEQTVISVRQTAVVNTEGRHHIQSSRKSNPPPKVAPKPKKSDKSPTAKARDLKVDEDIVDVGQSTHVAAADTKSHGPPESNSEVTFFYFLPSDELLTNGHEQPNGGSEQNGIGMEGVLSVTVTQGHSHIASWKQREKDLPQDGFGFGISGGDGNPVIIKSVISDMSANLCNLRDGDEVLSVNGHSVQSMSHEQVVSVMSDAVQSGSICLRVNRMGLEVMCQSTEKIVEKETPVPVPEPRSLSSRMSLENYTKETGFVPIENEQSDNTDMHMNGHSQDSENENKPEMYQSTDAVNSTTEDLINFDSPKHMNDLESIPTSGVKSFPEKKEEKSPKTQEHENTGKVKNSRNFFEQMMVKERDGVNEKSEQLKKVRKNREIEERKLEAQRGRKFVDKEPVKYEFNLESELYTQVLNQSSGNGNVQKREAEFSSKRSDHTASNNSVNSRKSNTVVDEKQKVLSELASNINSESEYDVNSEMEEFEAEFATQREAMMQQLRHSGNEVMNDCMDSIRDDERVPRSRTLSCASNGGTLRDPIEEALGSQRAPSRASGVIQPESYTPPSSILNTSQDSQDSLNNSRLDGAMKILQTSNQTPQGVNREEGEIAFYGKESNGGWDPKFSGPVKAEMQTMVFDPTGHKLKSVNGVTKGAYQNKSTPNYSAADDRSGINRQYSKSDYRDSAEEFSMAKKALDKKFREQKRDLYNNESNRIEADQHEHERQKDELRKRGDINTLNDLKRYYAEHQKVKDDEFEYTMNSLKVQYKAELNGICNKFNVGSSENFMESDMRLTESAVLNAQNFSITKEINIKDEKENVAKLQHTGSGSLSRSKYDQIKRWAEDTTQSMELNAVDPTTPRDEPDIVASQRMKPSQDGMRIEELVAMQHNYEQSQLKSGVPGQGPSESATGQPRRRIISANSGSERMNQTTNSLLDESRNSAYFIKKRPISGITRTDQSQQLQSYYTSVTAPPRSKARYPYKSRDVDNFNQWLDSLNNLGNASLPKVPLPPADNFVERIDLPNGDDPNFTANSPLPETVISSLLSRLNSSSNNAGHKVNSSARTNRNRNGSNDPDYPNRGSRGRKNRDLRKPMESIDENGTKLRKWKSAPFDVNEITYPVGNSSNEVPVQERGWPASQQDLSSPAPKPANLSASQNDIRVSNKQRLYKSLPPVPQEQDRPDQEPNLNQLYGNVPLNSSANAALNFDEVDFNTPPRLPPRAGNPVFQEMSVDDPGRKPNVWSPSTLEREDPISVPWNARSRDRQSQPADIQNLSRKFEFRDALDPHGFHSLSRQTQAVSPNASQQSSLLPSDQRIASLNSHNDASASSTLRSAQFTPQPPNSKPRIEGMSEVHQRENRKLRPKGRQFKFEDPCSRCGLPLGPDHPVSIEGMNQVFHRGCFQCTNCLQQIEVANVGTTVKVSRDSVLCDKCSTNDRGYQYTQC